MTKWDQLIAAREQMHLSQVEAAERLQVGLVTYQRWEAGRRKPQPQHMRRLSGFFGTMLDCFSLEYAYKKLFLGDGESVSPMTTVIENSSEKPVDTSSIEGVDKPQAFIAAHMATHLWSLAFMEHSTSDGKRSAIRQAIKEFDSMNTDNKNYQMTRREALCSLATLPMMTLRLTTPGQVVKPTQYGDALAYCAASVEACWALRRSSDTNDRILALQSAAKYLPTLKAIAHDSSQYRERALELAIQYALIKAFLARHHVGLPEAIQYGKDAVALSKERQDISLQLSAYGSLTWSYFYDKKYVLAEQTAREAEMLLQQYNHRQGATPLHSSLQGQTYSNLALTQARNGKSPADALGRATETNFDNEIYPFIDFKHSYLLLVTGWTCCYQGNQVEAMDTLKQRVDPKTLVSKIPQSELGRVETMNVMTLSSIKAKRRDIEEATHFWVASIEGAKALQSEQRFNEALANYELMEVVWPDEQRIAELRDYSVHW